MAERRIMSSLALKQWMTTELHKFEGCEGCEVMGIYRLAEPDEDGCNWSGPSLSSAGAKWEIFSRAVTEVVARARSQFNLE
jgi:hypothetical protein